jgi:SAM-dependent methyltransferase
MFPIANGVPRLRLDQKLGETQASANIHALSIAESFSIEWSYFRYDEDRTWYHCVQDRCELFLKEVRMNRDELLSKVVLDAGCGNGELSRGLNQFGCEVLAIDASSSVELAYKYFAAKGNDRTHFIQGDLTGPPLKDGVFDVIFAYGALHHNPSTREALRAIVPSLKPGGRIFIWVYRRVPGLMHRFKEVFRRLLAPLPLRVKHILVAFWLPQAMLRQHLRATIGRSVPNERLTWRERFLMLLDHYTPQWRWEHTPEEIKGWYRDLGYDDIEQTEDHPWGIGMAATRPKDASIIDKTQSNELNERSDAPQIASIDQLASAKSTDPLQ